MKPITIPLVLAAGLMLGAATPALASGSYTARPPTPKQGAANVDRAKYDLGQKVFNGKTAPVAGNAAAQAPRLNALQSWLPASVAHRKNLPALAGQLSDEQLNALEYYVNQRYASSK